MITFKTKVRQFASGGDYVMVPVFKRSHCDMPAFRNHPKYTGIANSDLFANALLRIRRDLVGNRDYLRLDALPAGVSVDISGFLAIVTITL